VVGPIREMQRNRACSKLVKKADFGFFFILSVFPNSQFVLETKLRNKETVP